MKQKEKQLNSIGFDFCVVCTVMFFIVAAILNGTPYMWMPAMLGLIFAGIGLNLAKGM